MTAIADLRIGGRWRLWEQFALRGAGFPVEEVLKLAPQGLAEAADQFAGTRVLSGPEWTEFEKYFDEATVEVTLRMQRSAASSAFITAITWQNRVLLDRAVKPFLAWRPSIARTSQRRQREELVAHYLQRFCTKNDTIGFFGPVGWGRFDDSIFGATVDTGDGLIAETKLYFASWAIDKLAQVIGTDPALTDWIAPRRVPFVRLSGRTVSLPGCPAHELTPEQAQILSYCDGTRSAVAIRDELGVGVPAALAELTRRRLIVTRLDVPADAYPERHLRDWLERVGDAAARDRGLEQLDIMERGRTRVRDAAGPDELSAAMAALESDYVALTDTAAAREKANTTAPGRALLYSDCRREATVRLGPDVLAAMAPLEPLLASATWLTSALADRVMDRVRQVFDKLGSVDLATFWFACMPILHGDAVSDAEELRAEFWARWQEVLRLPEGSTPVRLTMLDISDRARKAFEAPSGGWPAARYLSPDLMIAAENAQAVARGEFQLVLGELHVAMNTLGTSLYINQHPHASDLADLVNRDESCARLLPLLAKENRARLSTRIRQALVRPEDYYVALVDYTADPHRPRTLSSADVQVDVRHGQLVAILPDGAVFDLVDVFSHVLTTLVVDRFQILPAQDHTPRVTIDAMVVARETWRFLPGDLAFADEKTEARRYVRACGWRAEQRLPRFVFVTSSAEPRPVFVDLESPTYVNILAKAVRRLARADAEGRLTLTEMLPDPDQAWMVDDKGEVYTSELRFVAFDTAGREE